MILNTHPNTAPLPLNCEASRSLQGSNLPSLSAHFAQEDLNYLYSHTGLCEQEVQVSPDINPFSWLEEMIFLIFPTSAKLSAGAGNVTYLAASVHSESGHQSEIKLFVLEQTLIYHLFLFWPATRRDNLSLSPSEFSNNVMIHFLLEVCLIDGVGMRWHHLGSIWRGRLTEFQIFLFHNLSFLFNI